MNEIRIALLTAAMLMHAAGSHAQSLKNAQTAFRSGNWTVLRSIDTMNDKVSCTGVYKANNAIQLVASAMYVTIRGGIQSVTLRFGDNPARPMRLPQKMEKDVNAVMIDGNEFSEAVQSNRLRLEVLTLVRGVATEDLDITGVQAAIESIKLGCPMKSESDSTQRGSAASDSVCSESLVSRMKIAAITDAQIASACKQ